MRNAASLALLIVTLLTGIALGHARGRVLAGGTVILCSGEALRVAVLPGPDGGPVSGHAEICPDMALGLMAAIGAPPVQFVGPTPTARLLAAQQAALHLVLPAPMPPRARAPPVVPA
ncbi:hypothetical protein DRW48_00575 [Paracoccus suum]|uniref:DUF2946 domain-containing protein n=1 Tax=Paracoccus suum TaxID=2259340 RepID=A0A344PG92_9RHOB|nr:hypothetical protein [Paracoccus suum]AXC48397.1 hypothetical protein DRW48_00575 [Paracoccus suum]